MDGREGILIVNHQGDMQPQENSNLHTVISYVNDLIVDIKSRCGYVILAQDWYESEEMTFFWNWEKPIFTFEKNDFTKHLDQKNIDLVTITPDMVNSAFSAWSPEKNRIVQEILQEEKIKILHILGVWDTSWIVSTVMNVIIAWNYEIILHLQSIVNDKNRDFIRQRFLSYDSKSIKIVD